ncbi:MAG: hypothetical protein AAB490_02855 [Patescibacteria group bacterium]
MKASEFAPFSHEEKVGVDEIIGGVLTFHTRLAMTHFLLANGRLHELGPLQRKTVDDLSRRHDRLMGEAGTGPNETVEEPAVKRAFTLFKKRV